MKKSSAFSIIVATAIAAAEALAFDVTGQVLGISRSVQGWILLADGAEPRNFAFEEGTLPECRSGDIVKASGRQRTNQYGEMDFYATNVFVVGNAPLPETIEISGGQINDEELMFRCVRIRGVISAVNRDDTNMAWSQITLRTPTGKICAIIQDDAYPLDALKKLVDAEVFLHGYVTKFGSILRFLGNELALFDRGGVEIVRNAPEDPFNAPPFADRLALHRQRIDGVVVAADRHRIYLATERFRFLPVQTGDECEMPPIGSHVSVVGYAEADLRDIQLADAIVRVEPGKIEPPAKAQDVDPQALFADSQGTAIVNSTFYGRAIRIKGDVLGPPDVIRSRRRLQLACGQRTISVDVSRLDGGLDPAQLAGCRVAVAGYTLARFERDASSNWIPRFEGWSIVPRTTDDITVLSHPPWWTQTRLFYVIGVLVAMIAATLIWNHALRVASERRGARLARERVEHAKTELKAQERTRLAVELHDSISQTLTGVALQIDSAATANAESNPQMVGRLLATSSQMLASCRKELQCCLWDLRSRTFEEKDLNRAVGKAVAPYAGSAKVSMKFDVPSAKLSELLVQAIVRIVRELVSNAVRHGGATEISAEGDCDGDTIRICVSDNGRGFDPKSAPGPRDGHFGLRGIRERLAGFNGSLDVHSAPGSGARFSMTLRADGNDA